METKTESKKEKRRLGEGAKQRGVEREGEVKQRHRKKGGKGGSEKGGSGSDGGK